MIRRLDPTDLRYIETHLLTSAQELIDAEEKGACERSLRDFSTAAWRVIHPGRRMDWNWHLEEICRALEDFRTRRFRRLVINVPPRSMKSLLVNVFYPLWVWIQDAEATFGGPSHQFLTISHNAKLATRDAMQARIVLRSAWFQKHWGDRVQIVAGQDEKIRYTLTAGGHRNIGSMESNITGENADTVVMDDPHSAQGAESEAEREAAIFKFENEISSRTNDRRWSGFALIMQRLHERDMTGKWIEMYGLYHPEKNPGGVMHLVFPMEYELDEEGKTPVNPAGAWGYRDHRTHAFDVLWPDRVPKEEVLADIKAHSPVSANGKQEVDRDTAYYNGQLQQRPSPKSGGILKKAWWRAWKEDRAPNCVHTFASWDTAYSEQDSKRRAFSACTVWGVFSPPHARPQEFHLILLGAWYGQVGYPDLKAKALEIQKRFNLDAAFIEKKASGISLIQDLRSAAKAERMLRIRTITPDKDKLTRAHVASETFSRGMVWAPQTKWAADLIDRVAMFPKGAPPCADIMDTVSQAVVYLREGYWAVHPDDEDDDPADIETRTRYDEPEDREYTTPSHGNWYG